MMVGVGTLMMRRMMMRGLLNDKYYEYHEFEINKI